MKVISDFNGGNMDADEILQVIKLNCNLFDKLVILKIEFHIWHEVELFDICELDELYYKLDELIQENDCKNGCELREDENGRYFSILGSNRCNRATGEFIGTDEIKVYFKNYHW